MAAKYEITIQEISSLAFKLGHTYSIALHFKNPNGTYTNDHRLPNGYRQKATIDSLPFSVTFDFPELNFYISDIITCITVSNEIMLESGEVRGELNLLQEKLEVLDIKSLC